MKFSQFGYRQMTWGLIIFDCDGVLVDSEPIQTHILARMLEDMGLRMSYDEIIEAFTGRSIMDCLEIAEQRLGWSLPADFEARLQEKTFVAFERELQPVLGVEWALDKINVPQCVASSGSLAKMRKTLGLTGLLPKFEGRMFSATKVPRGKPHPDLFHYAAHEMGVAPAACAIVEDSVVGVKAGVAAGMTVFGYATARQGAGLAAAGAKVFADMRKLPNLLTGA
jgi:HAD superfamily hydrolase (TIGR01509 family)